jgi:hypothetical protein
MEEKPSKEQSETPTIKSDLKEFFFVQGLLLH